MGTTVWKRVNLFNLLLIAATIAPVYVYGQENPQYAIERAQNAVRERIGRENGFDYDVTFPDQPQTYSVSNALTGVRGRGMFAPRDNYRNARNFTYDVVVNVRNGNVDRLDYRLDGGSGGGGGGGDDFTVPSWIVGTYRGRNPSTRQDMTLIINRRGRVRAVYDSGGTDRGDYVNGQVQLGSSRAWDITQSGRDLRVRDTRTGRSERFKHTSDSADDGDIGIPERVPQWMIGTFRGFTDSGESELSITRDGSAFARSLTTGRTFNGRYENGRLTFEFGSYDVQRDGNGIRTVNLNNRRDQTSYRRAIEPRR